MWSCCAFVLSEKCRRTLALFLGGANIIQVLSGLAVIFTGGLLRLRLAEFSQILEGHHSATLENMMFGTGLVMLLVHGFASVICFRMSNIRTRDTSEKPWMYVLVFILLFSLFVTVMTAAIMTSNHRDNIEATFGRGLTEAMARYGAMDSEYKPTLDKLQTTYRCCGVERYEDWFSVPWSEEPASTPVTDTIDNIIEEDLELAPEYFKDSVPFSCCDPEKSSPCVHADMTTQEEDSLEHVSVYGLGCSQAVGDSLLTSYLQPVSSFFFAISIIETLLLVLFRYLQTSCDIASMWGDPLQPAHGYLCGDPPIPPRAPVSADDVEARTLRMERVKTAPKPRKPRQPAFRPSSLSSLTSSSWSSVESRRRPKIRYSELSETSWDPRHRSLSRQTADFDESDDQAGLMDKAMEGWDRREELDGPDGGGGSGGGSDAGGDFDGDRGRDKEQKKRDKEDKKREKKEKDKEKKREKKEKDEQKKREKDKKKTEKKDKDKEKKREKDKKKTEKKDKDKEKKREKDKKKTEKKDADKDKKQRKEKATKEKKQQKKDEKTSRKEKKTSKDVKKKKDKSAKPDKKKTKKSSDAKKTKKTSKPKTRSTKVKKTKPKMKAKKPKMKKMKTRKPKIKKMKTRKPKMKKMKTRKPKMGKSRGMKRRR